MNRWTVTLAILAGAIAGVVLFHLPAQRRRPIVAAYAPDAPLIVWELPTGIVVVPAPTRPTRPPVPWSPHAAGE